jgi:DNA-binding helix-hairpin-helix protein with protein kinase domain
MGQDLTQQWLAEIQALKQQVAELVRERDAAWKSTQKWQKLYNTEAEQRRADTLRFQQEIASLKAEIRQIQGIEEVTLNDTISATDIEQEISRLNSVDELKTKLVAVTKERDRLLSLLKTEQDNHAQTRKSLTTALGDAIDSLARDSRGK